MPSDDDRGGEQAPDESRSDQPARDDLIDPEDIDPDDIDPDRGVRPGDEGAGIIPGPEELPESQGADVLDAERLAEDATSRPLLSDEEAEADDDRP